MTAVEILERAISKLETLRDGHSAYGSHPWRAILGETNDR